MSLDVRRLSKRTHSNPTLKPMIRISCSKTPPLSNGCLPLQRKRMDMVIGCGRYLMFPNFWIIANNFPMIEPESNTEVSPLIIALPTTDRTNRLDTGTLDRYAFARESIITSAEWAAGLAFDPRADVSFHTWFLFVIRSRQLLSSFLSSKRRDANFFFLQRMRSRFAKRGLTHSK